MEQKLNIHVKITLNGVLAQKASRELVGYEMVDDLVDVIQRLESDHPFLRTTAYYVAVNNARTDRNSELNSGDRIDIYPKTPSN